MYLPETFIIRAKELLGDEMAAFEKALTEESPVSIRLNPRKINADSLSETLPLSESIPWAVDGYYLDNRPSFTSDPLFHAGCYYVQEASSMILEYFVRNYFPQPAKVLDLCAAPGGKSTHLSALLEDESLLIANEVIRSRANILSENLIKWGNPNTWVICNDPAEIGKSLPAFFDVIVADLPCSGEGMFRKNPAAIAEWSINNVQLCAERQRRIVADVWPALKPGGILIYSTCTYNREENEENLDWICCEFDAELLEEPRRLMPHKIKGEGFFIAGIRKKEKPFTDRIVKGKTGTFHASPFADCLSFPENYIFVSDNSRWIAVPANHYSDYLRVKNSLRILSAGVALGEMKGRDRIPAHDLAMSNALSEAAFPRREVDKETALSYLRKEALRNILPEIPKGYVLITYKGHPLGFIKNIGTRANNLYPQEWRIRMK
ncbi:MAG: rRNA cytosine-C5-methyltransferase [Candidatus Azobacteroides sp.]|nr:rRNA cytosine-C5-methyltransferase [Candidatus Azobacteroides sp.]